MPFLTRLAKPLTVEKMGGGGRNHYRCFGNGSASSSSDGLMDASEH